MAFNISSNNVMASQLSRPISSLKYISDFSKNFLSFSLGSVGFSASYLLLNNLKGRIFFKKNGSELSRTPCDRQHFHFSA